MLKFIARRICIESLPTLLAIATITFFMIRLAPGGPFDQEREYGPGVRERLNAHYGFDDPVPVQYLNYLKNVCKGDLGPSFTHASDRVNDLIAASFPVSAELGLYALMFALIFGLGAGIIASIRPNSWSDYLTMSVVMVGICVPTFVLGPVLVLVFSLKLGWFSVSGWETPAQKVLPAITLGAVYAAYIARMTRGSMLEVLTQDFIRTARAKGLKESTVVLRHGLRNGILPVVSFLGPAIAGLVSGSFVVEQIFQINGLGRIIVNAALKRDYFVIMGTVLLFGGLMIVLNTIVDIVLAWLNPKARTAE